MIVRMRNSIGLLNKLLLLIVILSLTGCATMPENVDRTVSTTFQNGQDTALGRKFQEVHPEDDGKSGFLLLDNGLDAFVARAVLAQNAERSIDTQYYLLHDDVIGKLFIDQLYKAAERGVRVRLLVDDIELEGRDFGAAVLDSHPNIEVRIFNPFSRKVGRTSQFITGLGKQTRRMHNKSFTVDNQETILGGRNIGSEYFEAHSQFAFVDLDIFAAGPVAPQVSASFDQYWNNELSYPLSTLVEQTPTAEEIDALKREFDAFILAQQDSPYLEHLRNSSLARRLRQGQAEYSWAEGTVIADDPKKLTVKTNDTTYHLSEKLVPYLAALKRELIIYSPYFVPGKAGISFFKELRARGVEIKILTNSLASTNVSIVHAGYARYRKDLLEMGVQLYELNKDLKSVTGDVRHEADSRDTKSTLHAKCFVLDRERTFIGSLNLDPRSLIQNTEIGLIFDSKQIAQFLAEDFDQQIDKYAFRLELKQRSDGSEQIIWKGLVNGSQTTFEHDPYTGFWQRFGIGLLGVLPIESQI
jgi:putative cardiolipin synthase